MLAFNNTIRTASLIDVLIQFRRLQRERCYGLKPSLMILQPLPLRACRARLKATSRAPLSCCSAWLSMSADGLAAGGLLARGGRMDGLGKLG